MIFKKKVGEYFRFCWPYILAILVIGLINLVWLVLKIDNAIVPNTLSTITLLLTALAGWNASGKKFSYPQVSFVGFLCFLGVIWFVPIKIFLYLEQVPNLPQAYFMVNVIVSSVIAGLINWVIYILLALVGGWLGNKLSGKKK